MKRIPALLFCILLLGASCNKNEKNPPEENPTFADTATFFEVQLYAPGNYGSANWRIPAILCLDDGSLLAVCDKRKYNESDLPEDIDVIARRSTDNGRTWREPVTIAEGTGRKHGYGDPALVTTASGEVICAFAGGNGNGGGKQGSEGGNSNQGVLAGKPGISGLVGYTLDYWAKPVPNSKWSGRVTVRVTVNPRGQVTKATATGATGDLASHP